MPDRDPRRPPTHQRCGGVGAAYRRARATGCVYGSEQELRAQLADIRDYLGTTDPVVLVAAVLLEQAGYARGREQLTLFDHDGHRGGDEPDGS